MELIKRRLDIQKYNNKCKYDSGIIDEISGTFKDNYVFSEGTDTNLALGGALFDQRFNDYFW